MATRKSVSHYKIMDYWRDKAICKDGKIITEDEAERRGFKDTIPVIQDWGEPMCWGCNKEVITNYEKTCEARVYEEEDLVKIWSDKKTLSKLNRCHIVPASLGGEDAPENLFLMCSSCHYISPDTKNRDAFFRWVYKQREAMFNGGPNIETTLKDVDEELSLRGLPGHLDMIKQCDNMKLAGLGEFFKDDISTHGTSMAYSSSVVGIANWLEQSYREAMVEKLDALRNA